MGGCACDGPREAIGPRRRAWAGNLAVRTTAMPRVRGAAERRGDDRGDSGQARGSGGSSRRDARRAGRAHRGGSGRSPPVSGDRRGPTARVADALPRGSAVPATGTAGMPHGAAPRQGPDSVLDRTGSAFRGVSESSPPSQQHPPLQSTRQAQWCSAAALPDVADTEEAAAPGAQANHVVGDRMPIINIVRRLRRVAVIRRGIQEAGPFRRIQSWTRGKGPVKGLAIRARQKSGWITSPPAKVIIALKIAAAIESLKNFTEPSRSRTLNPPG